MAKKATSKGTTSVSTQHKIVKKTKAQSSKKDREDQFDHVDHVDQIEVDIVDADFDSEAVETVETNAVTNLFDTNEEEVETSRSYVEDILFRIPIVDVPLVGTPQQVKIELDNMALKIQRNPSSKESDRLYDKIHLYMHGYLISVALKQFPYIRGMQTVDIYQESLIALRFKAIPNFQLNKGMSFLNFAKLCIRRHLITILNASKNRQKDQTINRSISLDTPVMSNNSDEESHNTLSNIVPDTNITVDKQTEHREAVDVTKKMLMESLSDFEKQVLNEYLLNSSYRDIARNLTSKTEKRCKTKAVDNALLRIRKKAMTMLENEDKDKLPLFL